MYGKKVILVLTVLLQYQVFSQQYEELDTFFLTLHADLQAQYRICTEDTAEISSDSLLRWRNQIEMIISTPEYKKILKEFMRHTGIVTNVIPCEVIKWEHDRMRYLSEKERSLQDRGLGSADMMIDSLRTRMELEANPCSDFDFDSIPLGISRKVFRGLFTSRFHYPIYENDTCMYIEHFYFRNYPFMVHFFFNEDERFYRYTIDGYSFVADSLNTVVRAQSTLLAEILQQRSGPPDALFRFGIFDIKSGVITPYAAWHRDTHDVVVGIGYEKNRYYAKATVTAHLSP